jgi:DNA ligase-associated metallophosphoesterase
MFIPDQSVLIISDIHIGKVGHFRKAGIAVPREAGMDNYIRLQELILTYNPERVIFLGDLFHSDKNSEWDGLKKLVEHFSNTKFDLVIGNHEFLEKREYASLGLHVFEDKLDLGSIALTHVPQEDPSKFNIAGHIHPAVRLRGRARQSIRLPCFHIREDQLVLPAFGAFTGNHIIKPKQGDIVYAIADDRVVEFSQ